MTAAGAPSVLIVGAGPAGLTAAYRLVHKGHRVTVLDGRASLDRLSGDAPFPMTILGCHHATWALLESFHLDLPQSARHNIPLEFHLSDGRIVRYPDVWLPGPFRPLLNLLRWPAIPWNERRQLISWLERLWEGEVALPNDLEQRTATEWLHSLGQSEPTRQAVWNPLTRWLTGTDLQTVSAEAFAASLRPFFLGSRTDNRLTLFPHSMQNVLIQSLADAAIHAGATVRLNTEAIQLRYTHDRISGVQLNDGSVLEADWYVTAMSPQRLASLLPERWLSRYAYFQQLTKLTTDDQTIVQTTIDSPLTRPRLILLGQPSDYSTLTATDHRTRSLFSLTATSTMPAEPVSDIETKLADALRSLNLLPARTSLTDTRSHTMSNSVLPLKPGTQLLRPIQRSPVTNLLVAGAWTDTGWPCNLESAIESGNRCAWAIQGQSPS